MVGVAELFVWASFVKNSDRKGRQAVSSVLAVVYAALESDQLFITASDCLHYWWEPEVAVTEGIIWLTLDINICLSKWALCIQLEEINCSLCLEDRAFSARWCDEGGCLCVTKQLCAEGEDCPEDSSGLEGVLAYGAGRFEVPL